MKNKLGRLFPAFLKIGVIGFGGGTALIPVIEKELDKNSQTKTGKGLEKHVVVASLTPGALPVEIASGVGAEAAGLRGMLLLPFAISLPGVLATILLMVLFLRSSDRVIEIVGYLSVLVNVYILYLILLYARNTVSAYSGGKRALVCLGIAGVFFANHSGISTLTIIFSAFVLSFAGLFITPKISVKKCNLDVKKMLAENLSWVVVMVCFCIPVIAFGAGSKDFVANGILSSFLSFGGGDAYLSIADGVFVEPGYVDESEFYGRLVPVANALPGSILCKVLSGTGFMIGAKSGGMLYGLIYALAGYGISVSASCLAFTFVRHIYEYFEHMRVFRIFKRLVNIVIAGLLFNVVLKLIAGSLSVLSGF